MSTTSPKTYSEAVSASEGTRSEPNKLSASEGTRSEPNKTAKTAKTTAKRSKKQYVSPEVVPSEWDRDSDESSKSEKPKKTQQVASTKSKSAPKISSVGEDKTEPTKTAVVRKESIVTSAVTVPSKSKALISTKSNDPFPSVDPFKSKRKVSKLIDKDSISHLTFKKTDPPTNSKAESLNKSITKKSSDQAANTTRIPVLSNPVSEAAKTLLNGPITFNKPVNKAGQKSLDNYFVPQGRTGRSISSQSTDHPQSSAISESVAQSDGSDLDIITG